MDKFDVRYSQTGNVLQSAIPKSVNPEYYATGLLIRGVVISVYTVDGTSIRAPYEQTATYCDVLTYSQIRGLKTNVIKNVLVNTSRGGLHEGRSWAPRPATYNIELKAQATKELLNAAGNPADYDGDHVLVGFMDNDLRLPVVICGIPHPRGNVGLELIGTREEVNSNSFEDEQFFASDQPAEYRVAAVGQEYLGQDYTKHRGVVYGVDQYGNFLVDARHGNIGDHNPDGTERVEEPGTSGSVTIDAGPGGSCVLNAAGGSLTLTDQSASLYGGGESTGSFEIKYDGTIELRRGDSLVQLQPNGDCVIQRSFDSDDTNDAVEIRISDREVSVTSDTLKLNINGEANQPMVRGDELFQFLQNFVSTFQQHTHTPGTMATTSGPVVGVTAPPATSLSVSRAILNEDAEIA